MLLKTKMALAAVTFAGTLAAAVPALADDFGVTIGPAPGPYYGYDEQYTGPTFGGPYAYGEPDYGYSVGPDYSYDDAEARCAARFRSYNPMTHSYLGYDGIYHSCP